MLVIIDLGLGNMGSIFNMCQSIGIDAIISSDKDVIQKASKIILPGVGAFDEGMNSLERLGLTEILNQKVLEEKVPILGICLGFQLFSQKSEEGKMPGLGWLDAETIRFPAMPNLKVPHMGWNTLKIINNKKIIDQLPEKSRFYFVHSFHVVCQQQVIVAETQYGIDFVSVAAKENIMGTQFHPEKSHRFGKVIFKNFAGDP